MNVVQQGMPVPVILSARAFIILFALMFLSFSASAECTNDWIARVVSLQGSVDVRKQGSRSWEPVSLQQTYCTGDTLRVLGNSRAALELHNETILRLNQHSTLLLSGPKKKASWLDLIKGSLHAITRVPRSLKIKTPFVNAAVEGTEFQVTVNADNTLVGVFEGKVAVSNEYGRVLLAKNQSAITYKDKAPVLRLDINPKDSVQWSLYYPALNVAELTSAEDLLRVGQVDAAAALLQDQRTAEALALRSVIAIALNNNDQAIKLAEQAVTADQSSAVAYLAQSYAFQATFDLDEAKNAAVRASELDPNNAIAWARLAELQLSLADFKPGLSSAKRAVELQPNLARTQAILGFAHLLQYHTHKAKQSFQRSIELDSSDPLSRLGNGLALIRENQLTQGRREIEIAASLDTNNAQVRSYLGKAYLEENRNPLAAEQFALAKQLDPKDPTPWLYDALRKQSENNPIGALVDLEQSKALNDNRAVFRSRQLLDHDAAIRSNSIARIYNVLGADQLALQNAWSAVNADPANSSAHRFLADTYSRLPRHKIAQTSELLQSQLLQPLNTRPLQLQQESIELGNNIASGSTDAYGDYNSLFTREGVHYQFNSIIGNQNTVGEDISVSGLSKNFAYSFGQLHSDTDGFRENFERKQNLYKVFMQSAIRPDTQLQFEYRHNDIEFGDYEVDFDPTVFTPIDDSRRVTELVRLGMNHKISADSNLLVSLVHRDLETLRTQTEFRQLFIGTAVIDSVTDRTSLSDGEGHHLELQYLKKAPGINYVLGLGYYNEDFQNSTVATETVTGFGPTPISFTSRNLFDVDTQYSNAYLYANKELGQGFVLSFGASYDDILSGNYEVDEFNPKLGLTWRNDKGMTLRAAYFEGVTHPINAEQTIEPTQVAGFNQFFDDVFGSITKRYGAGIDQRWGNQWSAGLELSKREMQSPLGGIRVKLEETLHRTYLNWRPTKHLVVNADYLYEEQTGSLAFLDKLTTHVVPISMRYFWGNGHFAGVTNTYVDQKYRDISLDTGSNDEFWLTDVSMGFRLPGRRGVIQLDVKNLFDKTFFFQPQDYFSGGRGVVIPRFVPDRQIFARFSYAF